MSTETATAISKVEHIIEKLRDELKQTKELVADLESRLELTEHTSHLIVNELRTLISESDNNTTTSTSTNDTNTSNATTLFTNTASTVTAVEEDNDGQEENVEDLQDKFYDQFHDHLQIPLSTSSTSSPSPSPSPLKSSPSITSDSDDTTNDSFNRICNVLQNLIDEAQNSEKCWFCLETNSTIESLSSITPKSSRCNSISQKYNSNTNYNNNNSNINSNNLMVPSSSISKDQQQQKNLIKIQKKYKKILEKKSNYNKSCDNIELELQKLINTALSTTTTNNAIHNQHMIIDNKGEEGECGDNKDGRFFKNKSLKWKKRILDYLKSLNNNYNNMNAGEGKGEDNDECKDDVAKSSTSSNNFSSSEIKSSENIPDQSSSLSQSTNNPLIKNLMNLSAMIGIFVLGMKRTIDNQIAHNKSMLYRKSHLLRNAIIIITTSSSNRGRSMSRRITIRRKYNYYLSIKLAKYFTILLVGWLFGRIGSGGGNINYDGELKPKYMHKS
ncbi:8545_t:CDS:2 [Entrophospora sp. SA101]|nr:8545_t:CDS:2 [Entrophospora sp. SA101]